jgi:hypothetical protein
LHGRVGSTGQRTSTERPSDGAVKIRKQQPREREIPPSPSLALPCADPVRPTGRRCGGLPRQPARIAVWGKDRTGSFLKAQRGAFLKDRREAFLSSTSVQDGKRLKMDHLNVHLGFRSRRSVLKPGRPRGPARAAERRPGSPRPADLHLRSLMGQHREVFWPVAGAHRFLARLRATP